MTDNTKTTAAHLVLSAGGVRSLSYAGAISALAEQGITFASVSACSSGSFIGALLCTGMTPGEIVELIGKLDLPSAMGHKRLPGLLNYLALLKWPFAKYDRPGFPDVYRNSIGGDPTFAELKIPFATAGVDIVSERLLVYSSETHPSMKVSEAMEIAVAIPLLYPPHQPPGRIVLDAAVASECPVWLATGREDELPIVALKPSKPSRLSRPKSFGDYIGQAVRAGISSRDAYIIDQIPSVRVIEIDCADIRFDQFNLSHTEKDYLITAGRDAVERALKIFGPDLGNITAAHMAVSTGESQDDRAEAHAAELMARFNRGLSNLVREQVFISYSRSDQGWLNRLHTHLSPFLRNNPIDVWDDSRIAPGARWADEIQRALASTKVAVLLVSPSFLASDFIVDQELSHFLDAARKERVTILWVPISASAYQETALQGYQAAYDPDQPLDTLSTAEQNKALVEICQKIKVAIQT